MQKIKYLLLFLALLPTFVFADETITTAGADAGDHTAVCYSSSDTAKVGVTFTPATSGTISAVTVTLNKSGAPTSILSVGLEADTSGHPSDTYLGSGTKVASDLTTSFVNYSITLDTPVTVTAGTPYWVVASCNALSTSNYYQWQGSTVSGNVTKHLDTATWNSFGGFYAYANMSNVASEGETTASTTATTTTAILGSIGFGLAVIITMLSLFVIATIYGMMTDKKKKLWQ